MRLLVTGGRYFTNRAVAFTAIRELNPSVIIQGECPYGGADKLAADYAELHGIPCIGMKAFFRTFGKSAGPRRNSWMLKHAAPIDCVLALPGDRGTANMIEQAEAAGIHVIKAGWPTDHILEAVGGRG